MEEMILESPTPCHRFIVRPSTVSRYSLLSALTRFAVSESSGHEDQTHSGLLQLQELPVPLRSNLPDCDMHHCYEMLFASSVSGHNSFSHHCTYDKSHFFSSYLLKISIQLYLKFISCQKFSCSSKWWQDNEEISYRQISYALTTACLACQLCVVLLTHVSSRIQTNVLRAFKHVKLVQKKKIQILQKQYTRRSFCKSMYRFMYCKRLSNVNFD